MLFMTGGGVRGEWFEMLKEFAVRKWKREAMP